MHTVADEEKFLFDVQGFLILRGAIEPELVRALDQAVVANEAMEHDESWAEGLPVVNTPHFTKDTHIEHQVSLFGLPRLDPVFDRLIAHPSYLPYLKEFMGEPQLVNAWAISKYEGRDATHWHNGLQPHEYTVRDGVIRSQMVNVVTMLTPNHPGDGCFAVIPGSHKKNLQLDYARWGWAGLDTPGAIEITGDPGDVMVFTEALVHTGAAKTSARRRTTLQYNHVHSSRAAAALLDTHNARHYWMPPSIRRRFTADQEELTHWMDYTIPDRSVPGTERSDDNARAIPRTNPPNAPEKTAESLRRNHMSNEHPKPPEPKSTTELVDVQRKMAQTWAGQRPVDTRTYPYFNPDYEMPFLHIGSDKQLLLDNFILAGFDGVERVIVRPEKTAPALIQYENLPWERYHWTCVPAAALQDPDDGLFKMSYKTLVSGNTNSSEGTLVVLCYAESKDALHWTKPLRDDCQPFEKHSKTNIVMNDFDNGTVVLNPDRSDPNKKFLAVYNPSQEATQRGHRVMSRVAASPDGIRWQVINDDSEFRHHHQSRIIWDAAAQTWIGYSQASHAFASHRHIRTIGRQESTDFINWSPKQIILSSDWDPNVGPNVEFHTMSVRKEGDLYIAIVEEAHGEHQWLLRQDGGNQHDQFHTKAALYVSRDSHQFFRADGYQPWADNGPPGSQDYG